MPLALAAGTTKLALFSSIPGASEAERKALPASVFTGTGVIDAACRIAKSDFKLGAKEDKTVTDPALCDQVESEVPTFAQYEGSITPFRYFKDGKPEATGTPGGEIGDAVYQALKTMGTRLWIARRDTSKKSTEAWAVGDEYELFEVVTGSPQQVEGEGYIKRPITLYVQRAWTGVVGGAAA